jgi:uncharacterized membrane protein YiaA
MFDVGVQNLNQESSRGYFIAVLLMTRLGLLLRDLRCSALGLRESRRAIEGNPRYYRSLSPLL